ncbi:hypothetical protein [Gaiella occulta]|nr:hypothetical protein [Gaiella occulta]
MSAMWDDEQLVDLDDDELFVDDDEDGGGLWDEPEDVDDDL